MSKFKKWLINVSVFHKVTFIVCLVFSIILLVSSFLLPPTGIIDNSVLKAVAEIGFFSALAVLIRALDKGVDAKVSKGDISIEITNDNDDVDNDI